MRVEDVGHLALARRRLLERIDVVLDVGANEGQYAATIRAAGYRGRIVSFEPLARPFAELARRGAGDPAWECLQLALGAEDGGAQMNVARNSLSSSLLPMGEAHLAAAPESRYVGTERVEVARLDSLALDLLPPAVGVYLKIDVQGFERAVLEGARETLGRTAAIECELSLVPLYEEGPLFPELVGGLESAGFDLVAVEPVFTDPGSGKLLQLDGLFVRR